MLRIPYKELCFDKFKGYVLATETTARIVGNEWRVEAGTTYLK